MVLLFIRCTASGDSKSEAHGRVVVVLFMVRTEEVLWRILL